MIALFKRIAYLCTIKTKQMSNLKQKRVMKIQEVINEIRNSQAGVLSIVLTDASRYAANSVGPMTYAGTLYTKKYANRQKGDEVIATGNKETNLTAVERTLTALVGKGEVQVRLMNGNWMIGEVEA